MTPKTYHYTSWDEIFIQFELHYNKMHLIVMALVIVK